MLQIPSQNCSERNSSNLSCTASRKIIAYKKNYLSYLPNQIYVFLRETWSLIFYEVKGPRNVSITYSIFDCVNEPVSLIHIQYTSSVQVSAQQCWINLTTAAHCRE